MNKRIKKKKKKQNLDKRIPILSVKQFSKLFTHEEVIEMAKELGIIEAGKREVK